MEQDNKNFPEDKDSYQERSLEHRSERSNNFEQTSRNENDYDTKFLDREEATTPQSKESATPSLKPFSLGANSPGTHLFRLDQDVEAKSQPSSDIQNGSSLSGALREDEPSSPVRLKRDVTVESDESALNETATRASLETGLSVASSLSQMERDIIAKTDAQRSTSTSLPGAVAVPASNVSGSDGMSGDSSLSQMERDVISKTQRFDARASLETGLSVASSLSQMELDIITKTDAQRSTSTSLPGAVAVPASHVSGSDGVSGDSSLSQMERDVVSKTQRFDARRKNSENDMLPRGFEEVATGNISSLRNLEQDVAVKNSTRPSVPAVSPGALAEGRDTVPSLSQVERDVIAKTQSRRSSSSISRGAAAFSSSFSGSLSQREQDIIRKTQGGGSAAAETSPLFEERREGAISPSLASLENQLRAKSERRPVTPAVIPGAVSSRDSLLGMEQAVIAKTEANIGQNLDGSNVAVSLSVLEQDIVSKSQARRDSSPYTFAGCVEGAGALILSQIEEDIIHKTQTAPSPGDVYGSSSSLAQFEAEFVAKSHANPTGSVVSQASTPFNSAERENLREVENINLERRPPNHNSPRDIAIGIPEWNQSNSLEAQPPESAPAHTGGSSMDNVNAEHETEGSGHIQAFVADPEVVDATGVAVILSEDEENELERKSRQKLLTGGVCFILLLISLIVIVVVVSGSDDKDRSTSLPTIAPTSSPTFQPTTVAVVEMANCLSHLTSSTAFLDRSSPQFAALLWITNDPFVRTENLDCNSDRVVSRYILVTLFYSMNGDQTSQCGRSDLGCPGTTGAWLSENFDVCDWVRVSCSGDSVTALDLEDTGASSTGEAKWQIPKELAYMSNITELRMVNMNIEGSIEGIFDRWEMLQVLDLSSNRLEGPLPSLSGETHPSLWNLVLKENEFSGQIPTAYGTLAFLQHIDVSYNKLSGATPDGIFALPDLSYLELSQNNNLTGSIPSTIISLTRIEQLRLEKTKIGGPLPSEFYTLSTLRELYLTKSAFSGSISSEIVNLVDLRTIDFSVNKFSGRIPEVWSEMPNLENLILVGNPGLTGAITPEHCESKGIRDIIVVDCEIICDCCAKPNCN